VSDEPVCFLALRVPLELARREHRALRACLGEAGARLRLTRAEGWHVTLFYLGASSKAERSRLHGAFSARLLSSPRPELALAPPGAFPARGRERVLWFGVEDSRGELALLRERTLKGVEELGRDVREERGRPFVPHVTVARARGPSPRVPAGFYRHAPAGGFSPPAVELLESVRGEGPARYETRAAFALGT